MVGEGHGPSRYLMNCRQSTAYPFNASDKSFILFELYWHALLDGYLMACRATADSSERPAAVILRFPYPFLV